MDEKVTGGGMWDYLRRAFLSRWNLLLFFGASAGAVLTPWPDVFLPLVTAGEMLYLVGLVSVPRFREAVDAEVAARARETAAGHKPGRSLTDLIAGLPRDAQQRFGTLRARCLEMRTIAQGTHTPGTPTDDPVEDLWTPALDRLLYGFLRLLDQQSRLRRFLKSTDEAELAKHTDQLKAKLAAAQAAGDDRMIHSLQESVAIAEQRQDNYRKAAKNGEFADLELDRVESKIQALVELAANRQDPNLLSSQVDAAAESMHRTETALGQLQQIVGAGETLDDVPAILDLGGRTVRDDA